MARQVFQHDIIKKIISVFASVFDEIKFTNGHGEIVEVPLMYAPREKWLEDIKEKANMDQFAYDITFPRISFEMTGMNYAPERHTNPVRRITDGSDTWTYNRIAYDFQVSVYIAATRMNDGNRIVEQILPFFSPELNLTVKDMEDLNLETNIPIVFNSVAQTAEYEGSFDDVRLLSWELQFTIKAFLYQDIKQTEVIKKTIVEMRALDYDRVYERLMSRVDPIDANRDDEHTIIDTIEVPPLVELPPPEEP